MIHRITLIQAARLAGAARGTVQAVLSKADKAAGRRNLGVKAGRERMVDLAETALIRTAAELQSGNLNVHEAFRRAVGLSEFIAQIATKSGPLGQSGLDAYAVDAWGKIGASPRRIGYICQGSEVLAECIKFLVRTGWTSLRTVNLSQIISETLVGWSIARQSVEEAKADFEEQMKGRPTELVEFYRLIFDEMKQRLGGTIPADPPADGDWREFDPSKIPPAHVAAVAMGAYA
jgi:hypothetical protein